MAQASGRAYTPLQIVDLRQLTSRQLEPFAGRRGTAVAARASLDYRASIDLIKKFVDARSLTGLGRHRERRAGRVRVLRA